jgi:ABC-2 type transport system permease protein
MNLRRTLAYFPAYAKGYLRSPVGLFFSLIFPVILVLIFGAVFSSSGSSAVPLTVENLDHNSPASQAFLSALNDTGTVSITLVSPDVGNLSDYLAHNDLSAGLVIPAGFNASLAACTQRLPSCTPVYLLVFTNPSSGSEAGIVEGAVQGVANGMNLHLVGGSVVVTPVNLNVGNQLYHYIDYLVPGLIGFSVLVSPMFSMVNVSSTWKRDKLFRQLSLTPLSRSEWLTATFLWYVLLAIVSTLCLLGVGRFVFGAHVTLTLLALPFLVVGPVLFVALGLLAGSVSSTPESAAVIGNIITFPMMFLSGTFFPVSMFPSWLVPVAHVLPLYYVIDGLNAAMVFGNAGAAYFDLGVVLVVAIAFSVAASHVFNWRED